jgi:hypothetical protein
MGRKRKKTQDELLNLYKANISWALKAMEPMHEKWKRFAKMYAGEQWEEPIPEDAIVVNQVGPIINTILPSMYTNQPKIRTKPMRPQDAEKAPLLEQVLAYDWNRIDVDNELRRGALDMLVYGMGWVLVGYEYEEMEVERTDDEMQADLATLLQYVQELAGGVPPARVGDPNAGTDELQATADAAGMGPDQMLGGPEAMQGFLDQGGAGGQAGAVQPTPIEAGGSLPGQTLERGMSQNTPQGLPMEASAMGGLPQGGPQQGGAGMAAPAPVPPDAPPVLAALLSEEQGGSPAEDSFDPAMGAVLEDGLDMGQDTGPGMNAIDPALLPSEEELAEIIPKTQTVPFKDDIFVEHVSPFDVFVDPEARKIKDARWVARRRIMSLEEVQANPAYKHTKNLQGDTPFPAVQGVAKPPGIPGYQEGSTVHPPEYERVTLWEYYNLKEQTVCVFTLNYDRFLMEADWLMPYEGSPFVPMVDYVVPDSLWGYGEVELIEGLQMELNKTRTQIIVHNKRFNRKLLYKERAIDDRGKQALASRTDGALIPVINDEDLKDVVLPVPDSPLPADRYQINNIIESDITAITGISDYERGAYNNVRRTATEASIIMDASSLRQQDKLRRIEQAATIVGRRMAALAKTFYDQERWILITGSGWQVPIRFTREDIEGEYDIQVDAGSTEPTNQQMLMQDRERLYQLLSENPLVNQAEILKELLRAHGFSNPDKYIDQQAVMMQKMEQMMMMAGAMGGGGGGQGALPGQAQPGQLGLPAPEEVQGGVVGGAQAAGVAA